MSGDSGEDIRRLREMRRHFEEGQRERQDLLQQMERLVEQMQANRHRINETQS